MSTDTTVSDLIVNKLTYAQWKSAKDGGTLSSTQTYDVTDKDTAFVHTTGNETIAGNKTFSGIITLSGTSTAVTPADGDDSTKIATTAFVKRNGGSSRNIGEIVSSTVPLTDAGLHLLDGSLIQSGSYSAFVTYIAGLVSSYPDLFCSEIDWQTAVTNFGVCGKFVYTSGSPTTIRLPKITGIIEGTTDLTALGDLIQAGLPDHNHELSLDYGTTDGTFGVFDSSSAKTGSATFTSTNASDSSSIYGNSDTVQPQTIKVLYYIVVANSTKTEIEVDIDNVMSDLAGKADTDLSNCSNLETVHVVIETYQNGRDWYRIYDDNWCEQGGVTNASVNSQTVTLLKPFADTNYSVIVNETMTTNTSSDTGGRGDGPEASDYTLSTFRVSQASASGRCTNWEAKGYIA